MTREVEFLNFSSCSLESFALLNILFLHLREEEKSELGKELELIVKDLNFLPDLLSDIRQVALLCWFLVLFLFLTAYSQK